MTGIACELGAWAADLRRADVSDAAVHAARRLLLDRFGISLGGTIRCGMHPTVPLAARMTGTPSATVWANATASQAPYAALANGCSGDMLELAAGPECAEAALVAGDVANATLGEVLLAIVAAAELNGYARRWLGEAIERHGLHPPANLGPISTTAAAGKLLGLSQDALGGAVAAAVSLGPQAPYAAFSGGASGKTLYGGWPHMLGIWAALWAQRGTVGPATAIEGSRGVAQALLDAGGAVQAPVFDDSPTIWDIEQMTFKAFPCNRASHPALTVLASLGEIDPAKVQTVDVATYPYAVELQQRSRGDQPIAAQVSMQHSVALYLVLGGLDPGRAFAPEHVADPRVLDLARRVSVRVDPRYDAAEGPRVRGAHVRVTLRGGSVLEGETGEPRWGPSNPATDAELLARFERLTLERATAQGLGPAMLSAPESTPVRSLLAQLRA